MTTIEYERQRDRVNEYEKVLTEISALERKKTEISFGVASIESALGCRVELFFGEDFRERLTQHVLNFFDSEIENSRKRMEEI